MRRVALVAALATTAASATVLTAPVKLPLRWVDRGAYVTTVVLDGVPMALEVGTMASDVWLACSSLPSPSAFSTTCKAMVCTAIIPRGGVSVCTSQTKTTLSIATGALQMDQFSLQLTLDVGNASSSAAQLTSGELGLGLRSGVFGSMYPEMSSGGSLVEAIGNFSLFLTDAPEGNGSFVQLGGSIPDQLDGFDKHELSARQLSTRFSLPLRFDKNVGLSGWDLSLTAVRFGNDQLLYPRVYTSSEVVGSDARVSLSANDPVVKMPPSVFKHFREMYMGLDCGLRENGTEGYECSRYYASNFPRITIYVGDKIFYLDPSDYTVQTSTTLVVLISSSSTESRWVLGTPFLRKFPSMFSLPARSVELLCQFNVTCDSTPGADAWERHYIPVSGASNMSIPIEEGSGIATAAPMQYPAASAKVVMWMGFLFGALGCSLALVSAVNRWRHRHDIDFRSDGTVASDKDLEELELAARDLSTSESFSDRRTNFTPLASPAT